MTTNEDAGPSDAQIGTVIDAWFTYDEAHAHDFKWRMRNALLEAQALAPSKVQVEAVRATWQPIETAPKDGTKIVIAVIDHGVVFDVCNGHFEILEDDEEDGPWDICDGEPVCSYIGREAGTYFCCWLPGKEWERGWKVTETFEYTHWMPLPEAPDAAAASGGEKV